MDNQQEESLETFIVKTYQVKTEKIDSSASIKNAFQDLLDEELARTKYRKVVENSTSEHFRTNIPAHKYEREYALDAMLRYHQSREFKQIATIGPDYFQNGFIVSTWFSHRRDAPRCVHTMVKQKSKDSIAEVMFQVSECPEE